MKSPFPGMDPYLEHPSLWPDVHNRLIAALADAIVPMVAPRYYVALERRAFRLSDDDVIVLGRPDISVVKETVTPVYAAESPEAISSPAPSDATETVIEVEVPLAGDDDDAGDNYLEVREVKSGRLVMLIELLSPANKLHSEGRRQYVQKRSDVLHSAANLIEIDLLRAGEPMPLVAQPPHSDYRILVSRAWQRPRAQLHAFGLRQAIPCFPLPLMQDEKEPQVDLNGVLHALYDRARFDLRLNYGEPPVPPLAAEHTDWAKSLTEAEV